MSGYETLHISNIYHNNEPVLNISGPVSSDSPNLPKNQFKIVVKDTIEKITSEYTPHNAPNWFRYMINNMDMLYNIYMYIDCNTRYLTPEKKLKLSIGEMMDNFEPINQIL